MQQNAKADLTSLVRHDADPQSRKQKNKVVFRVLEDIGIYTGIALGAISAIGLTIGWAFNEKIDTKIRKGMEDRINTARNTANLQVLYACAHILDIKKPTRGRPHPGYAYTKLSDAKGTGPPFKPKQIMDDVKALIFNEHRRKVLREDETELVYAILTNPAANDMLAVYLLRNCGLMYTTLNNVAQNRSLNPNSNSDILDMVLIPPFPDSFRAIARDELKSRERLKSSHAIDAFT